MKKILVIVSGLVLVITLASCSTDTYNMSSKSTNFLLKNVVSVTLSGPGTEIGGDNTEVVLDSQSGQQFNDFVSLVKGKKLDELPEPHQFGMALITYTTKYDEEIKAYPANDGSNYIQLYSLNELTCKYLELDGKDMKTIVDVFERNGIIVNYAF